MTKANQKPTSNNALNLQIPLIEIHDNNSKAKKKAKLEIDNLDEPFTEIPHPFLKWVGGKRGIINELKSRLPIKFNNYYEPFVGGGALYWSLSGQLSKSYISDMNLDLIIAYSAIKKDVEKVIAALKIHQKQHSDDYYYFIRSQHDLQDPIEVAARIMYLNKTCYNGLWRVNSKGEFNVPVGSYINPGILDETNLLACSKALKHTTIEYKDYSKISPIKGDFVYFDPPYHPTVEGSFTKYSKLDFTEKDQSNLADFCTELTKHGVYVMISNSSTKFIKDIYKSNIFKINFVSAPRVVNCKPNGRNAVEEVLITNY